MPRAFQQGDEPVRGYRLVKFLGKGGYGDVWQASGPGGTEVAFKIIKLKDKPGFTDLRSVELIKKIRHPNLCPILAMWIRDDEGYVSANDARKKDRPSNNPFSPAASTHTLGEFSLDIKAEQPEALYVAMGLGEKSLLDRLKECQAQGEAGIPSVELISYFEDASRAIDHLNAAKHDLGKGLRSLPHCDIKPQNILIVGGAVQVCDYGLSHVLGELRNSSHPGVSIGFTSPEMLETGVPSPYSDQYSLAITYYFLRTGALPFSMNETNVILTEALEGRLDLSQLSTAEQQVIRRAASRRPEARFANCQDLARELRRAIERAGSVQQDNLVIEPNREIVPGHKLVSLLGRGAYGEVWEAQAPGRVPIALKIIKDLDRVGGRGKQEYRALEIIQHIHHNSLMELRAYWLLDRHGQPIPDELRGHAGSPTPATLVIATRLADRNLTQVMEKYQEEGKPGIPAQELLGYMKQVAQALDYLNQPRHKLGYRLVSIQHRDVKPDNIMLANDVVKLTDFGLAKVLETENIVAEIKQDSVGFTFHYAAPEVLRGKVTRWSDQYSMAITYYQLRTGQLPYGPDCSAYDQMMRQLEGQLDLERLLKAERMVITRATSVLPEERFESCQAFINALVKAVPANGELMHSVEEDGFDLDDAPPPAPPERKAEPVEKELARPAVKTRDEHTTMPVMLQPQEVYPAPLKTPSEVDANLDTQPEIRPVTQGATEQETVQTVNEKGPLRKILIPLAGVFAVGIGMALLVNQLLDKSSVSSIAQATQPALATNVIDRNRTGEFVGPLYVEEKIDPSTNVTTNKTPDIIATNNQQPAPPITKPPELLAPPPVATKPIPVPTPVFVLGKNIQEPGFPSFLQARLDSVIANANQPVIFSKNYRELEQVPASAYSSKLFAFRAECMMEGENKNLQQADHWLKQMNALNAPTAYTHYVQARFWQEMNDPKRAVTALEESLKRDISLTGFRRDRALTIFEKAAERVNYVTDVQALSAQVAAPIPAWLPTAERFIGKNTSHLMLSLLAAIQNPIPKHPDELQPLLTSPWQDEILKMPQGPVLLTSLKLKQAESAQRSKLNDQAIDYYAQTWQFIKAHRTMFEATSPLTLYERILRPAQQLAATTKLKSGQHAQLATIYAAQGELIFDTPYENWPELGNKPALRVAADAYGQALKLYPGSGRTRAEYLTGQGQCLNRLWSLSAADIAAITTNANAATQADPTFAGGWNLMGIARYYQLAQGNNETELRQTLNDSIAAYDKAIQIAESVNPRDRVLAIYRSNRSLAKSMLGDYTPIAENQRQQMYQDAINDALQATQLDKNYEAAWESLGQARERLAVLLGGAAAQTIFESATSAYRQQLEARPSMATGHAYLGRCLLRWALNDKNDAARLEQSFSALQKAIKLDPDLAEAQFWLGRYYLIKNDAGRAVEAFYQATQHASLGSNLLSQAISLLQDQPLVLVPLLNRYIPADRAQCTLSHASPLIVRSNLIRRSITQATPWEEVQKQLHNSRLDAQTALRLLSAQQVKMQADALEASATANLVLFARAGADQGKADYRRATMNDIRALLKTKQVTNGSWELASYQARFLDQDAIDAGEEQAKALRQEAIEALDVALVQAPQDQRDPLRRLRNDIQSRLR